jgi:cytochrome c
MRRGEESAPVRQGRGGRDGAHTWVGGLVLLGAVVTTGACGPEQPAPWRPLLLNPVGAPATPDGDPRAGARAIQRYGCGACHAVPGVPGAHGAVGPPLGGLASRQIIAGRLPNTRENLLRWIEDPQAIAPGTAMPTLGVTATDARDLAAYLYTLK